MIGRANIGLLGSTGLVFLLNTEVHSEVLHVPKDYPSILSAVDAATDGDSVLVAPGTWTDREVRLVQIGPNLLNVVSCAFLKPGISVIGTSGAEQTIIDGGPQDVAGQITLVHNLVGTSPVVVEGFTILAGGDGFVITSPSPIEIKACRIEDCWARAIGIGRAIGAAPSKVILDDCIVRNCGHPGYNVGAIHGSGEGLGCDLELRNTRFEANLSLAAVRLQDSHSILVDGCEFVDHQHRALSLVDVFSVRISQSLFLRNSVPTAPGGAVFVGSCQDGLIKFCTFAYDSALSDQGGGLVLQNSNASVMNCTFYGCYAPLNASAFIAANVFGSFDNNVVANSTGGPALRQGGGNFTSGCNLFWANEGGNYSDWVPSPADILADPNFCDPQGEDWTVDANSPCTPENSNGCGWIGAHEIGCGTISLEGTSWGRIKELYR
jgi:hypothetical protein